MQLGLSLAIFFTQFYCYVNLAGLEELNSIYAQVLYKGHGKDRQNARSYRTISTCPLLAKALDIYVNELSIHDWNEVKAAPQFQGQGMSHELASLLLTEVLQFTSKVTKVPVYALFLDARSAFDRVIKEILIRNLFIAGTNDQRLIYINERLTNRKTFCDYRNELMGPILDIRGLEQGGISSSEEYKLYNNEQASSAHSSRLGVKLGNQIISCISLADDAVLLSSNLTDLKNLLLLTSDYCKKYGVDLVPDKTLLLAFNRGDILVSPDTPSSVYVNGHELPFSTEAQHLGVLRTTDRSSGNIPSIMDRLTAYRKQLFSLFTCWISFASQWKSWC